MRIGNTGSSDGHYKPAYLQISDAKYLYQKTIGTTFSLDHCWDILRDAKKWQDLYTAKKPLKTPKTPKSIPNLRLCNSLTILTIPYYWQWRMKVSGRLGGRRRRRTRRESGTG